MVVVREDRGLSVSLAALRCQLTAMPCGLYEVRLIHSGSRKPYPGVRQWTTAQLSDPATVGFLRIRNREGYDVYFRPYAGSNHNAGYILLDLDDPVPGILTRLRAQGHEPCVVAETSPGRWQAWIRVCTEPLLPALATRVAKRLAQMYAADRASADWRHLGRLAGFTNRKPERRQADGLAPWVKLIHARACLAGSGAALLELPAVELAGGEHSEPVKAKLPQYAAAGSPSTASLDSTALAALYRDALNRLRIRERYPAPDWSIADRWVARELLTTGTDPALVAAVVRHGSPGFPRRHADPEDYLRRTIQCAALFSRAPRRHLTD
jgi:hypothetical protein